ncbi:MAG: LacI family DNA-binding transcriptional regulator [Lachnospiraceae bacterium]
MAEIKLSDIARELQISVVTVSNALSGKKGVSEELREKVVQKAKELGYDCSRYEKKKNTCIGVLVPGKYVEIGASFYWELYQHVAYSVSQKMGNTIIEIVEWEDESANRMPKMLQEKDIDGLIIVGYMEHEYVSRLVKSTGSPIVLLDFKYRDLPCDAVVSGNYVGMYKMTRYLLDRGHKKIAFFGSIHANENIMDRYFGYRKGMEEFGISYRDEWVIDDRTVTTGKVIPVKLPEYMPTAFVCNSDFSAGVLYDCLVAKGYRVPEDISIVGYDNYLYGHSFGKELTTYNVDMRKMADTAVKILRSRIKGSEKAFGTRYIDSCVVERSSVKVLEN